MVGKSENILVEFDYNNITIIDPNKVIDSNDKVLDLSYPTKRNTTIITIINS